jgi:hypothetical protein
MFSLHPLALSLSPRSACSAYLFEKIRNPIQPLAVTLSLERFVWFASFVVKKQISAYNFISPPNSAPRSLCRYVASKAFSLRLITWLGEASVWWRRG